MNFKQIIFLLVAINLFIFKSALAQHDLYAGEQLVEINKVQTLFKFIKGESNKPLIIFIPGAAHLARISYGFPLGKEDDFLSYWLHKKGYSFLGISYPTDNHVYTKLYPAFTIRDWGNQVATLAKKIITQNHLSNHVVIVAWSMGGNLETAVSEALNKSHINMDAFIGLSAVTPLSYLGQSIKGYKGNKMLPNELLDASVYFPFFFKFIEEQNTYNGHTIIPKEIYQKEFLGNFPVAIEAQGYQFMKGKFVYDVKKTLEDSSVLDFAHTPWIGLITDDSFSIPRIVLIDTSAWKFIRREMLFTQYITQISIKNLDTFNAIKKLLTQIDETFSEKVHGNHFFFVGKKGARDTAQKIELIMQRILNTKQILDSKYLNDRRSSGNVK